MKQTFPMLVLFAFIIGLFLTISVSASQTDIVGPAGSGTYGSTVTVLPNGNIVVTDPGYDIPAGATDVGAVYLYDGATLALISTITGGTPSDQVGNLGVIALTNSNYVVRSSLWDNPSPVVVNASAVTFGNGASGTVGLITSANSVVGTVGNGTNTFSFDVLRNRLFVGRSASNIVSILFFNTNAIVDGNSNNPATWDNSLPNALVNGIIPSGRTVTLNSIMSVGQLAVECGGALTGGSASSYVIGSIRKEYCAAVNETFLYPLGDVDDYSPMQTTNLSGTGNLIASVNDSILPGLLSTHSASRFWNLNGSGITTDLSFTYTNGDINGSEISYKVYRRFSGITTQATPSSINAATNTATVTGVSSFSDWGVGNMFAPKAASAGISGRITTAGGRPIRNVTLVISGGNLSEPKFARTNAFGYYHFVDLEVGQTYILSVAAKRYTFANPTRTITLNENLDSEDFVSDSK
jgi:Repeat of unknown function (DUF5650)/Carboxypeptidase regulatory-like domain